MSAEPAEHEGASEGAAAASLADDARPSSHGTQAGRAHANGARLHADNGSDHPQAIAEANVATYFRVSSVLRSGRLVQTWLASDERDGSLVVIKSAPLAAISSGAWMRLEHDVEELAKLETPSFTAPLVLSEKDGVGYLVTPFVPGVGLDARLHERPLTVDETLVVGRGMLQALREAHGCGVLHRNVKPENVIVPDEGAVDRATLADFGLGRSSLIEPPDQQQLLRAARYASPEQAGLLARAVDERSDLYSVGVVLFECVAGVAPFEAETVGDLLRRHLTIAAPSMRDLGLDVPRVFDEFIQRLLAKDPRDRYQSAQAALADLIEIEAARRHGIDEPPLVIGLHDPRSTLVEPAFVGRADEFAGLDAQFQAATEGAGGLVVLEAESGGGKTRLLDELAHRAARAGAWVLRAEGIEQVASRPVPVIVGIAQEIVSRASLDANVATSIKQALGDLQGAVCAVLPELAEMLEPQRAVDLGPEAFAEARIVEGLTKLLEALGSSEQPAVVILDDCQWSSRLTSHLLEHWQLTGRSPAARRHVLLVVAFRSEEVPAEHPLRRATPTLRLVLPPLADSDVERLAETMAGELPAQAREAVVRLSRGNPFMASAVLRGLVECGALIDEPFGWRIDQDAMGGVQSSREAADFLARRLELLSDSAHKLLAAAAVLGKEFDLDVAAELARQRPAKAVSAIEEARRRDIVWERTLEPRHAFVHDKVRDAVLVTLRPQERRRLHHRAALMISRRAPEQVFELAYHFDAAGEHERAQPFAMQAAAQARARHTLDSAEQQYRIAERAAGSQDAASRLALSEGLGDVLMLQGRYDPAQQQFEVARSLAAAPLDQARIDGKIGELAFKRGDMASASAALEQAIARLGQPVPRSRPMVLLRVLVELVVQTAHTVMPRLFVGRRSLDHSEADLLAARLYSRLAHVYWFQRGKLPTFWSHVRGMNVAERYPPTPELAQAYSEHAPAMGMLPNFERGIRYARKSLELRRGFGDPWAVGQSLHYIGAGLYAASEFEESIGSCREAIRLLERTGDRWELNTARWHLAFNHYRRGELAEAVEVARAVHRDGIEIGDAQASGISLGAWSKATGGQVPPEAIEAELARPVGDIHTRAEVLQAEAVRLIGSGQAGEAAAVLEEAWRLVHKKGLRQEYVSPVLPWLASALRLEAWRTPLSDPRRRRALLRKARSAARRGLALARRFKNNLPHALREMALAEAVRGRQRRARRLFEQSLRVADDQGARFEYLQTLLAKGRAGQALGWSGAGEEVVKATRGLAAMGAQPIQEPEAAGSVALAGHQITLSQADRFQTLLEVGRLIATGLSREAVFETLREAGESLLRGEECVIMAVPPDGAITDVRTVAGATDPGIEDYLQAMALEAMGKGEILIYSFEAHQHDPLQTRLAFSGIRSALCAPIMVRGRPVGCFYVAHRRISGLFGEDERRLAGFIATLGGAALENAAGFAAAQELASSLKRRTSQLEDANRRLDYSVKELTNAYERERQIAGQLNHMAFHDSLTNLPNRVLLSESVEHAVRRAQRSKTSLAVLFLDLDDFKTINDSLGHGVGDELLISVAQRLRGCVRDADTAARISGDEFAILLEDVDHPDGAARSAERILEALQPPFTLAGTEVFVRASIGIALGPVESRSDQASELLRNADLAMYMAKSEKKGGYRFFAPGMHAGLLARLELKADLERALGQRDFTIHYQPIVSLVQGTIDGLEALIRWRHPTRGLMNPSEFLPLAEETGLVRPVGHWVLREACRQGVEWQRRVGDRMPLTISVNLSPSELLEPELVQQVATALRDSGLRPDRLILELTESVFMQDTDATMERLSGLKRLGVKLAIDDFGTGYSSLGYLQRFPLDRIKVAKQFVDDVSKGAGDSALTRAIIKLGETFELETVAEGIEQPAQLMRLREIGCKLGQGHYFARALPADEIGELLCDPTPVRELWQPAIFGEPRH